MFMWKCVGVGVGVGVVWCGCGCGCGCGVVWCGVGVTASQRDTRSLAGPMFVVVIGCACKPLHGCIRARACKFECVCTFFHEMSCMYCCRGNAVYDA